MEQISNRSLPNLASCMSVHQNRPSRQNELTDREVFEVLTCTAGCRPSSAAGVVAVGTDDGRRDAFNAGAVNDLTAETVDEVAKGPLQRRGGDSFQLVWLQLKCLDM